MTVFLVVQVKVKAREAYDRYSSGFMEVFSKYDGTMLAADFEPKLLDGEWDFDRLVMMSFPDEASLKSWITSDEYQTLTADRTAGAQTIALMAKGIEAE